MKDISPIKVTFVCFVFLMVLLLTGDLVMAIYGLLVAGVIGHFIPSDSQLLKIGGIVASTSLVYPLVGVKLALVAGFLGGIWVFKKSFDGRFAFGTAIFFLILCPVLLALKLDKVAEEASVMAFYFLATGTLQEMIGQIAIPKEDEETGSFEIKPLFSSNEHK